MSVYTIQCTRSCTVNFDIGLYRQFPHRVTRLCRRSSCTGIINKAFTLEHVSEEGDTVNTPEQSLSELPETPSAISRPNPLTTSTIQGEDIEMVEFMV